MMKNSKLTETTLALMKYAKSKDSDFTWTSIRDDCLGRMYTPHMRLQDVVHVVTRAWLNARQEPRLEMPYDNVTAFAKVLIEPLLETKWFPQLTDTYALEQIFQAQLNHMMHELKFTKVDWIEGVI